MNQYPTKQIDRRPRLPLFDKCLLLFGVAISVIGIVTGKWQELQLVEVICIVVVVSVIRAHYRHTRLCCPTCKIIIKMQSDESSKLFVCEHCRVVWDNGPITGSTNASGAEDMFFD